MHLESREITRRLQRCKCRHLRSRDSRSFSLNSSLLKARCWRVAKSSSDASDARCAVFSFHRGEQIRPATGRVEASREVRESVLGIDCPGSKRLRFVASLHKERGSEGDIPGT